MLVLMVGLASAAGTQSSASVPATGGIAAAAVTAPVTVVGNWNLYYDWTGTGKSYLSAVITFKSDGTFTTSQKETGTWTQVTDNGLIIWKFTNNCVYGGNVAGKAATGIMSLFPSSKGVWYAVKQ